MLLDKPTSKLEITVGTAIGTGYVEATVEYEDTTREALFPATLQTVCPTGTTEVLGPPSTAPTARRVLEIHVYNADNATHDITVLLNTLGIKFSGVLPIGKTLHYNRFNGWAVV